jgi:pyoverdine/dityrosine biosynthesis protein Dit1
MSFMNRKLLDQVFAILHKNRKNPYQLTFDNSVILEKINWFVSNDKPIKFVFPVFHGKSLNRNSIISHLPDAGELIGLQTITHMCEEINAVYSKGVELIIIHEGHFYIDTGIMGSDKDIEEYLEVFARMHAKYPYISDMNILNFFGENKTYKECRQEFYNKYLLTTKEVEELMQKSESYRELIMSYRKFYTSEFKDVLFANLSRSQRREIIKEKAIEHLKLYVGFGNLTAKHFNNETYIKLSALYKPPEVLNQVGINIIPNCHTMATTGFFSLVKNKDNSYNLMKKKDALALGYKLDLYQGFVYYQQQ